VLVDGFGCGGFGWDGVVCFVGRVLRLY